MDLWKITYTNILTGERQSYMDVGFESPESAKDEIRRLMRDAKKYKEHYKCYDPAIMMKEGIPIPSAMIGKNWRVKKIKCKKA